MAVSYSLLCPVREIWFVSNCHSRQGISWVRAPLCPRSTASVQITSISHFVLELIGVVTNLWESGVVYR